MTDASMAGRATWLVAIAVFFALVIDGMDFQMLALSLPAISKELHLSSVNAGALSTCTLIGMSLGGAVAGWLADRIGRVRVVSWSVLIFSAFTSVIALCHTYSQIAFLRFISGFGIGALYSIGTLLEAEYVPTRTRAAVLGALQAGYSVGYIMAALLSTWLLPTFGWRALFGCAVLPGILVLILLRNVADPPSWTATRATISSYGFSSEFGFGAIWSKPSHRRTFLLWTAASMASQFGYYGAVTWLPSYLAKDLGLNTQNTGWYVAGTYTAMVISKVCTGYLGDLFGRRTMWTTSCVLTALYLPILVSFVTPANVAYLLVLFGLLYGSPLAIYMTYLSESFPGGIRGRAVATSHALGKIGSTLSPLIIGLAASASSIGAGIRLLGISYLVCAAIPGLFIREKMFDPQAIEKPRLSSAGVSTDAALAQHPCD
jgi:AAHS family cis,cis-muconate transporter-like MFS transporter